MESSYFIILFMLIVVFLSASELNIAATVIRHRRKKGRSRQKMNELILKYIGKKCIISTMSTLGGSVTGVIKSVNDSWLEVETQNGQTEIINSEYIIRIKEYPVNKKGKEKKIVFE